MEHQWSVSCCERYHFSVIHQMQGLDVANTGGKKLINKAKICSAKLYENWRISELLVLAVLPVSCSLLSCCVFNSPNSVIWISVPLSYRAREMHPLQCSFSADTRTNMKKNAGVRHLMSPLRLTLIVRRRGDFLCLKGEVSLEVKAKHRNGDFCILGQWEWIAQKIQNIKILHRAKLSMCNISFSLFLSA